MCKITNTAGGVPSAQLDPSSPQAPSGGAPIRYTSPSDGGERRIDLLTPASKEIPAEDIAALRGAFRARFGATATAQALRHIDQRLGDEDSVTARHVVEAQLAAMEYLAPGVRLNRAQQQAERELSAATRGLSDAERELQAAKSNLQRREKDYEDYGGSGALSPGLTEPRDEARQRLKQAEQSLQAAGVRLDSAKDALQSANESLDLHRRTLQQPLPGDEVRIEKLQRAAQLTLHGAESELDAARTQLQTAQRGLDDKQKSWDYYAGPGVIAPGLRSELEQAKQQLAKAQQGLRQAQTQHTDAQRQAARLSEQLTALRSGPSFQRTQALLDHIGGDPRFHEAMDKMAPGKAAGGSLGSAERVLARTTLRGILGRIFGLALPAAKIGFNFRSAVKAEDRERRLAAAAQGMHATPFAKALAHSLSADGEMQKWKLGMQGTIGMVFAGMTVPAASALSPITHPATSALSGMASRGVVAQLPKPVVQGGVQKAFNKGLKEVVAGQGDRLVDAQFKDLPSGSALPLIPIKPFANLATTRQLPLSDPEVAMALLVYAGPKADPQLLADPKSSEQEQRRLTLRREMFGADDDLDLRPGGSLGAPSQAVIEQLDQSRPPAPDAGLNPLQLLYLGLGWAT